MRVAYTLGFVGLSAFSVRGQAALYHQCGGIGWSGPTTCVPGANCTYQNEYYWQCTSASAAMNTADGDAIRSTTSEVPLYGQCGGKGWNGATTCVAGAICTHQNDYYSQCHPSASPSATTTTTAKATPSTTSSHTNPSTGTSPTTSSTNSTSAGTCGTPPASAGKFPFVGVNIPGFDFGTDTNGGGSASAAEPPLPQYNGPDGPGQMSHFAKDDKYNLFRVPVSWQFLTADVVTGTLNQENFAKYDMLVKACLAIGASCIIDIHNYARYDGGIIGQGGPSNEVFAALWTSLASRYSSEPKVMFGIMNEPHDLDVTLWAKSVQTAVTAIRNAGAKTQVILLPGDHYCSAFYFVTNGAAAALSTVTNPDGTHTNLIFDVHRYLDSDGSGTSDTCVTDNIQETWEPLARWLRCNGRQALITETGGGNTASCEQFMCQQIHYLAKNSDVIVGYVGWGAGSFSTTYTLSETPVKNGNSWNDEPLVTTCMAPSVNGYLD